ncbi:MAG TPA: SRPBCC domain-containing protein [Candidatus Saccharimonadia bacterium]|nr:SRPBCC domain-containing protein [Candidatus Saccharimonadia bacterium]
MSTAASTQTPQVLTLTHRFAAPPEQVFAAFSSYENLAAWFGPEDCSVIDGFADFREGGNFLLHMRSPRGLFIVGGTYKKISPPDTLEYTWQWKDDSDWDNLESIVHLEFVADGKETEIRLTQTGFPNADSYAGHVHGWESGWTCLAAYLEPHA